MGLLAQVREILVHEPGVAFVDRAGRRRGIVMANTSGKGAQTMTSEYEIMRGDLVELLNRTVEDLIDISFGVTVESFVQRDDAVLVQLSDGSAEEVDVLIGADGQGSRIRGMLLPSDGPSPYQPVGIHMAYWFIPRDETDSDIRETYNAPGGRMMMRRSHAGSQTQVYFAVWDQSTDASEIHRQPVERQKEWWAARFQDAGWLAPRFLGGMASADFFYSQEIVQVRTPSWSNGRVGLVGDAGYCPSPYSGMGTSGALVGAYVLAGEIAGTPDDVPGALVRYHEVMRPFVDRIQAEVNPKLLRVGFPQSQFGINALLAFATVGSALHLPELAARFAKEDRGGDWQLPRYRDLDDPRTD